MNTLPATSSPTMQRSHQNPYPLGPQVFTPHSSYTSPHTVPPAAGTHVTASTAPHGWVAGGIASLEGTAAAGLGMPAQRTGKVGMGSGNATASYATLDANNLGFKLLQKAGWQEGQGLGAKQQVWHISPFFCKSMQAIIEWKVIKRSCKVMNGNSSNDHVR